jgi:protein involved in polysaccharide export with SLBB domain
MFFDARKLFCLIALIVGGSLTAPISGWGQGKLPILSAPESGNVLRQDRPAESDTSPRSANYQLSAGDAVAVKVFRESTLDTSQRISKDGTINFPLLGVIRIAGKTTNEAASMIAALLDKDYIVHPQVSVSIVAYIKQKYTVLGQVNNPGSYDIPEEQTVDILTAIARAGGFTRIAKPSDVTVRRLTEGREEIFKVDAKRLMNDKNSNRFFIQPNDTISVGERFF